MSGDFFDTNILIYQFDKTRPLKQSTATKLIEDSIDTGSAVISFQVIQEALNVVTRKLIPPFSADEAGEFLKVVLMPLWRVMPSQALYIRALALQDRHRYTYYDSLIIAAALDADCTRLYSEDLQHGHQIEGLTIVNPFLD
jgi:predicted nucleic acid-binding protein